MSNITDWGRFRQTPDAEEQRFFEQGPFGKVDITYLSNAAK